MKIPGAAGGKLGGPDFPVKAAPLPQREASLQTAKQPVKNPVDIGNGGMPRPGQVPQIAAFKDLALSLGIPQDKLSSSLLSLIPFFSLPLDTKLIQRLRQEVLSLKLPQKDGGAKALDRIRPGALAAVAAAGKGLTLSTEALEKYAAAITGEEGSDSGDDGNMGGSRHGSSAGHDNADQDGGAQTPHPEDGLSPEQIRDMAKRIEGQSPLLGILNKIPGKDGRRWINLPFSFSSGGVDYRVSLRVLLAETNAIPWKAECLALDVATDSRRWSFALENAGKDGGTLIVRIYPPPEQPAALEGTLRELLGTVAEKVILKDMNEGVPR